MDIFLAVGLVVAGAVIVIVFPKAFAWLAKQVSSVKKDAPVVVAEVEDKLNKK